MTKPRKMKDEQDVVHYAGNHWLAFKPLHAGAKVWNSPTCHWGRTVPMPEGPSVHDDTLISCLWCCAEYGP